MTNQTKFKVLPGGCTCREVNPYKYNNGCVGSHPNVNIHEAKNKFYTDFEANKLNATQPTDTKVETGLSTEYQQHADILRSIDINLDKQFKKHLFVDNKNGYSISISNLNLILLPLTIELATLRQKS